jgi:hypothetical protein
VHDGELVGVLRREVGHEHTLLRARQQQNENEDISVEDLME